jgi:hypothetical protein
LNRRVTNEEHHGNGLNNSLIFLSRQQIRKSGKSGDTIPIAAFGMSARRQCGRNLAERLNSSFSLAD